MGKIIRGSLLASLSVIILMVYSCTPQSCIEETTAYVKASFYNKKAGKLLAPDSVTIYGLGMETNKLYNRALRIQPAKIPLNDTAQSCILIIKINGKTDTLEFRYSSFPHLVSKECGYTFYHTLDTDRIYTKNAIIDLWFYNRNITTINEENIRIFY
jgi:hypothetical protein